MEIVLISCPYFFDGEIELITSMFEEGLDIFHLRKPGFNEDKLDKFLQQIKTGYHSRIKVHASTGLFDNYRLGGIHIPVEMAVESNIIELKKTKSISVSSSFHSLGEVKRKNEHIDYAFLSPVFDSISKKNYKCRFDYVELKEVLPQANTRIIALGGCKADNLKQVKQLGFSGAAVLGAVWNSADPFRSYIEIRKAASRLSD